MKADISMPEMATKAEIRTDLSEVSPEVENRSSDQTKTSTDELEVGAEMKVNKVAKEHSSVDESTRGMFSSEENLFSSPVIECLSCCFCRCWSITIRC